MTKNSQIYRIGPCLLNFIYVQNCQTVINQNINYNETITESNMIMKTNRLASTGLEMTCEWLGNITTRKRSRVNVTMIQGEAARHTFLRRTNERHMLCFWSVMFMGRLIFQWSTISRHVESMKWVIRNIASDIVNAIR